MARRVPLWSYQQPFADRAVPAFANLGSNTLTHVEAWNGNIVPQTRSPRAAQQWPGNRAVT
jgi:hypothetical protein